MVPTLVVWGGEADGPEGLASAPPWGPQGSLLLDYLMFDAVRAGFTRVVFVLSRPGLSDLEAKLSSRYGYALVVQFAYMVERESAGGGTSMVSKPGPGSSGEAVWSVRGMVDGPFAVVKGNGFYGANSFSRLAAFLGQARGPHYAMVGFRPANTLQGAHGHLEVCHHVAGLLVSIGEGAATQDVAGHGPGASERQFCLDFWGLTPSIFPALEAARGEAGGPARLADVISARVASGEATVVVLPNQDFWFADLSPEDRAAAMAALSALSARGIYPPSLFRSGA